MERQSYDDVAGLPRVLTLARERRARPRADAGRGRHDAGSHRSAGTPAQLERADDSSVGDDAPTLF